VRDVHNLSRLCLRHASTPCLSRHPLHAAAAAAADAQLVRSYIVWCRLSMCVWSDGAVRGVVCGPLQPACDLSAFDLVRQSPAHRGAARRISAPAQLGNINRSNRTPRPNATDSRWRLKTAGPKK